MTVAAPPRPLAVPTSEDLHTETESAKRAGGPQDRAFYECACGSRFTAAVSTSVDCPRCGSDQAW